MRASKNSTNMEAMDENTPATSQDLAQTEERLNGKFDQIEMNLLRRSDEMEANLIRTFRFCTYSEPDRARRAHS